jgi:hypothetical protein
MTQNIRDQTPSVAVSHLRIPDTSCTSLQKPTYSYQSGWLVPELRLQPPLLNVYRALVGKPEGRTPLGKPRHRWEDNIKMDLPRGWIGA